jgi:C4-dicarboxylate-specific signal transduction histidine kinase
MRLFGEEHLSSVINQNIKNIIPSFYTELNGETFLLNSNTVDIPIEISSAKVPVGDKYSSILTIRDITTRKYVETQQRQRRAATEQATRTNLTGGLAAVLAHELNQPLSAIMSYASACTNIVATMDNPPVRVAEQLAKVTVQARRAGDIIRRLREFFQNSSIEVVSVDVRELINESIMLLEDELTNAQVDVEVSLSQNLIAAIDRIQIEQVLINLIKNSIEALKETPKDKKKIRLTATQSLRGDIEIVVSDSGPGIAPEIVDQLFSPFVTTRLSGMGLGLTISRSIVEAHNGRLWAELQSSSGAAMHFTIPMFNEG